MRFDVREIALGYALDLAAEKLAAKGIHTAVIRTPHVYRTMGDPPDKRGFRVTLPNPAKGDSAWASVWVPAGGVALAASTEGRFNAAGKAYHSLLDPRTGLPAEKYSGAIVQAADAATAQALAYAMFVNGGEGFDATGKAVVNGYVLLQGGEVKRRKRVRWLGILKSRSDVSQTDLARSRCSSSGSPRSATFY